MDNFKEEIFKGKSFSNILEEIYKNQKKKEKQIMGLINELKPLIKEIGDATLIVPLLKEYMDLGIKNDEHLIKMATIVQRSIAKSSTSGNEYELTDSEKKQLLTEVSKIGSKENI